MLTCRIVGMENKLEVVQQQKLCRPTYGNKVNRLPIQSAREGKKDTRFEKKKKTCVLYELHTNWLRLAGWCMVYIDNLYIGVGINGRNKLLH